MKAPKNPSADALIDYYSLSKAQRIHYSMAHGLTHMRETLRRKRIHNANSHKSGRRRLWLGLTDGIDAIVHGDWITRLSLLILGFGNAMRGQGIRGLAYLAYEIVFGIFLGLVGIPNLRLLSTLGQIGKVEYSVYDPDTGLDLTVTALHDDSFTILLYSIITIVLLGIFVFLWIHQLKEAYWLQNQKAFGIPSESNKAILDSFVNQRFHQTLLALPVSAMVVFIVIPIVMMIAIAFTNYDYNHYTPANLFDWVGFANFETVFSFSKGTTDSIFLQVFGQVLLWTLIWAFLATFTNYFLGMAVAMVINMKGIRLKKLWRTVLVTTIAIPQFVSLLLMNRILSTNGLVNSLLESWGWIQTGIPWLTDALLAKVTIVLVNSWIGIPYTMLIATGLLINIPKDLYESAKIDGANAFQTYKSITLPYMLFVTTPYLISQFVLNINNFNLIYLLSQGNPSFVFYSGEIPYQISSTGVGQTDILITWIYKMTVNAETKDYGSAAVIGILIAAVVAVISLTFYSRSNSVKSEKDFQ